MTSREQQVVTDVEDGVLTITINRPEAMNALNLAVSDGVARAMTLAESDHAVRVVVLAGAGDRAFSAGADLKEVAEGRPNYDAGGPYGEWGLGGHTRRTSTKPVIAAVDGIAYGGGFELALNADLIVASRTSRFALPEVKVGLFAGAGGAIRLARLLPRPVATRILLTGDPLSAEEAAAHGLIAELTEPGEALDVARSLARRIAAGSPLGLAATKIVLRSLDNGHDQTEAEHWARSDALFATIISSADAAEGARAFAEKRPPRWRGR